MTDTAPMTRATEWLPTAGELDDLELLLLGAYRPLHGFLGEQDIASVTATCRLADGTPWPVPITLTVPRATARDATARRALVLVDEEGTPIATVAVDEVWPVDESRSGVAGTVTPLARIERRTPVGGVADAASDHSPDEAPVLGVPVRDPLHASDIAALRACALDQGFRILLLPLVGHGTPRHLDAVGLEATCRAALDELVRQGCSATLRTMPLPRHPIAEDRERNLAARVAVACGATHVPAGWSAPDSPVRGATLPEVVQHRRTGRWEVADLVPPEHRTDLDAAGVAALVDSRIAQGAETSESLTPAATARVLRARSQGSGPGTAVLFTGLSGSGKSTLAKAVQAALQAESGRPVTLLDGDIVRRMLSSELGFSREHRELNVRRIGFVAAEITRHGGTVLCAPIAPYADVRAEVRRMVEQHGRMILVYVSTPLGVCEARDRKGLYANARRGRSPASPGSPTRTMYHSTPTSRSTRASCPSTLPYPRSSKRPTSDTDGILTLQGRPRCS